MENDGGGWFFVDQNLFSVRLGAVNSTPQLGKGESEVSIVRTGLALVTLGIAFWLFIVNAPVWGMAILTVVSALIFWGCWGNIIIFAVSGIGFQSFFLVCDTVRGTESFATFGGVSEFLFWGIVGVTLFKISSSIFERIHRVNKGAYIQDLTEYFSDIALFGSRSNGKY